MTVWPQRNNTASNRVPKQLQQEQDSDDYLTTINLHHAAHVVEGVYELEELTDVIGDGGSVGIDLSQVFLIDLTNTCTTYRPRHIALICIN